MVVVVVGAAVVVVVVVIDVVVVVVGGLVVVVVVVGEVVVVLPGGAHVPPEPHASQQLGCELTHAVPPRGALHLEALALVLHFVAPSASVRQQATAPGRPQVERAAQRVTACWRSGGRDPAWTAAFATLLTQLT